MDKREPKTLRIREEEMEWEHRRSPKGKYELYRKEFSIAMGAVRGAGTEAGGHPFEVELTRIPPGKINFPQHRHSHQWEYYIVLSGRGTVRTQAESFEVEPGDHFLQPPGVAHHIQNTGSEDLVYYVIADNPPAEAVYYPDSDKWNIKPMRMIGRIEETTYYDGEE